jgi:hypothetical protein
MFNLTKEVNRLQRLNHDKVHGLPGKKKRYDKKIQHIDGVPYETQAGIEEQAMSNSFHNHSLAFGRRLSKRKGQYHRPGGGFAGCITKGR